MQISVFDFIMGQALAIMFAEAVAVSWWVDALKGQTLDLLHFQWDVGQTPLRMVLRWPRVWGWVCIAVTAFAGLETLLQTASSSTTVLSSYEANMTATVTNALPAGFSEVIAETGHDSFDTVYCTSPFVRVLQNYTLQSPIHLDIDGCRSIPNTWCSITLLGVGFQYTCMASRNGTDYFDRIPPLIFQVDFEKGPWSIILNASWKDTPGSTGLVEYSANVS